VPASASRRWRWSDPETRWRAVGLVVFTSVAAAALTTFRDYGLTWDELFQAAYSEKIAAWFSSGFKNREALEYGNLRYYGGFADVLGWLAGRVAGSPSSEPGTGPFYYEARHLVTIAFGLLGLGATYRLAALVADARAGALAMTALALTPLYYGHLFNNPKDVPFAALSVCALYAIVGSARELPRVSVKAAALVAITTGLMIAVRPGGVFVFGYIGLLWLAVLGQAWRRGASVAVPDLARLAVTLILVCAVAWALMLACWPWGQTAPISHPIEAIRTAAHFDFPRSQRFLGQFVQANPPPLSYIPVWFAMVLPEFHFVAWIAGVTVLVLSWRARRKGHIGFPQQRRENASDCSDERRRAVSKTLEVGFIAFAGLFPPAAAMLLRSTLYDGVRQLIFILPPLCALAGIALSAWIEESGVPRWLKAGLLGAAALSAIATIVELPRLHPYESMYFNRLAGGLAGAASRFETDYWGLTYREGIEWVIRHPPPSGRPLAVANCSSPFLSAYFLDKDPDAARYLRHVTPEEPHDILLATTRWDCHRTPGQVIHIVSRERVPLLYVIRRDPPAAGTAAIR
jgi:hypothetical protein